jgi:sugar fermentation stimulation protein A
MSSARYSFPSMLAEGLIKSRPNRFIMAVEINGSVEECHCPSTGRIGSLRFEDIPCLLSMGEGGHRRTRYTVEAISLDPPEKRKKRWIGINQGKANAYVEFFLRKGLMDSIFGPVATVKREVKLGDSRLDFFVNGRDYLEVKTLLKDIPCEGHRCYKKNSSKFTSFDRLMKHFCDISGTIGEGSKAVVLICYIYDAPRFTVPEAPEPAIIEAVSRATGKGLENWQVNLRIDEKGVELLDYFKLDLF